MATEWKADRERLNRLERRKIYEVLSDPEAERRHQLGAIDESGADYLYPREYFVSVSLPKAVEEALVRAA